jgi:hypothetical protein
MIRAFLAGRDPVPREAPMSSCSVIFVKSFLLLRERNHRIARTDDRPSTSSRLRHDFGGLTMTDIARLVIDLDRQRMRAGLDSHVGPG